MKFRTSRDVLLRPLRVVTGVVERRQTLPVLSNVLLEVGDDGLTMRGTDLEMEVVARVTDRVEVAQSGAATVQAHKLADIWQSLPDGADVQVALESERVVLRSGRSRFTLATIPVEDFPKTQEGDDDGIKIALPHSDMRRLLDRTKFAMANGDVRYYLNGLLLELSGNTLRAAASDGHRMALCTVDGGEEVPERVRSIVPRKSVLDLERLLADSDEEVRLTLGSTYMRVAQGEYTLTTKLVDGQFPEVDRLIPRDAENAIVGDRETLRSALHRASILANESSEIRLQVEGDQMTIRATNPDQEEAEEVVAVDHAGKALEVGFNSRYIQDVLAALDTESVKLSMPDNAGIAVMEGPGAEEALFLVMPLRR